MADTSGDQLRLGGKLLKDLRVKDLKQHLEARGLLKTGTKTQLVARLKSVRCSTLVLQCDMMCFHACGDSFCSN